MKKWGKLFLISAGLAVSVMCASAYASKQAVMVRAEDEITEPVVEEPEQPAEETSEPTEKEQFEEWLKSSYQTYVVPLLGGISITSVMTLIITVVFTIIKNKGLDKKVIRITQEANTKYNEANEKYAECKEILVEVHQIYKLVVKSGEINEEAKAFIKEKMDYALTVVDASSAQVAKIDNLVKVVALLAQIESKVAKQSGEVVKSGIVEDINELSNLIKEVM